MRRFFVSTVVAIVASSLGVMGCSSDGGSPTTGGLEPRDPLPTTTGIYAGRYRVPTDAGLANAASYLVDTVDWTVVGDVVTLHYDLPDGLVGGKLPITLSGSLVPGATTLTLTGPEVTGSCVATPTSITCHEIFGDLGPLPISMAIVEQVAARDYPGPVADRVAVAVVFGSDPIGFVDIDLQAPVIDDHGGGGGL
ncbi:MAG: hypothetical protein IPQ07_10700 [Myxococcales bacterium]|nr:hypothetical protein [Myxococcales bacterium]